METDRPTSGISNRQLFMLFMFALLIASIGSIKTSHDHNLLSFLPPINFNTGNEMLHNLASNKDDTGNDHAQEQPAITPVQLSNTKRIVLVDTDLFTGFNTKPSSSE